MRRTALRTWGLLLAGMLVVSVLLAACTQPAPSPAATTKPTTGATVAPTTAPPSSPAATKPATKVKVAFATVTPQMAWYPATVAVHDLLSKNSNLDISVMATTGAEAPALAVNTHQADLGGPITVTTSALAYYGLDEFAGKATRDIRIAIGWGVLRRGMITIPDSKIKTIPDTKGKRLAVYTSMTNTWSDAILEAYGLDAKKDFQTVNMANWAQGQKELQAGRVDFIECPFAGAGLLELKEAKGGVIALPIDSKKLEEARAAHPQWLLGFESITLKPGDLPAFEPLKEPVPIVANPIGIIAHKDASEDVVYTYVKTLLARSEDIRKIYSELRGFGTGTAIMPIEYPYHPGAIKAYKELGIWTDAMQKAQDAVLKK